MTDPAFTAMPECGWFDDPTSDTPAHDPGLAVDCPVCRQSLATLPRKTISLMPLGGATKSYFFRVHKVCWDAAPELIKSQIESSVIDADRLGTQ